MTRPRAADDFAAIRARMEELQRERAQASREDPIERSDKSYFYSRRPSPAQSWNRRCNAPWRAGAFRDDNRVPSATAVIRPMNSERNAYRRCSGPPFVQRKSVRILLSNSHSAAISRGGEPSGKSVLLPSTRATTLLMPVLSDVRSSISISAKDMASSMISAQRSARL